MEIKTRRTTVVYNEWQPEQLKQAQENVPDLGVVYKWKINEQKPTWQEIAPAKQELLHYTRSPMEWWNE